jgi:hypothetical protein
MCDQMPLRAVLVFCLTAACLGCTSDKEDFVIGPSPVNAVAFNRLTLTPNPSSFRVTRGSAFNYAVDIHFDFKTADFVAPVIEFDAYAGVLNANGEFFPSSSCWANLKIENPKTASGDVRYSGTYTLSPTGACASQTHLQIAVFLFSSTSNGFSLASDAFYYPVN